MPYVWTMTPEAFRASRAAGDDPVVRLLINDTLRLGPRDFSRAFGPALVLLVLPFVADVSWFVAAPLAAMVAGAGAWLAYSRDLSKGPVIETIEITDKFVEFIEEGPLGEPRRFTAKLSDARLSEPRYMDVQMTLGVLQVEFGKSLMAHERDAVRTELAAYLAIADES